ncbi:MAG TPA: ribonuclease H-like YkuK family protein [Thermodesulfobacteriota bacterium]|nr:ribonuclease H-like YkuK family protein [Thermodesulfobacteriota bacterium]
MDSLKTGPPADKTFLSPTFGRLSEEDMFRKVVEYMGEGAYDRYNLIIGTDSFLASETLFVTAVVVHRVGHGGRYFYRKLRLKKIENMRQRIFYEATMSIELASFLRTKLSENGYKNLPVEIHLDVGTKGDTRDIIKEVVGMVTGSGYAAVTKPDSYGATKVADRHSR